MFPLDTPVFSHHPKTGTPVGKLSETGDLKLQPAFEPRQLGGSPFALCAVTKSGYKPECSKPKLVIGEREYSYSY